LEMVYPFRISKYARFRVDWKFVQLKKNKSDENYQVKHYAEIRCRCLSFIIHFRQTTRDPLYLLTSDILLN
jgi:hypothetical protein